jgi:hypothetical protein
MIKSARVSEKELKLDKPNRYILRTIRDDEIFQNAYTELKTWHEKWKETNDIEFYNQWVECKRDLRVKQRIESNRLRREHCSKLSNMCFEDRSKFWRTIRNLKKKDNCVNLNEIDFKSYYENLFFIDKSNNTAFHNEIEKLVQTKIIDLEGKSYDHIITVSDVKYAIERLNNNKAVGHDLICAEMYIYGKDTALITVLTWLLDSMVCSGIIPRDFNISVITPILKSGKCSSDPADFRPISVSSTIALLFEDVIRQKISLRPHNNQFGYRPMTSTKHAFFTVNETLNYYSNGKTPCWLVLTPARLSIAYDAMDCSLN